MLAIDDLCVGQRVLVTGFKDFDTDQPLRMPDIAGAPMEVVAISLPFVTVRFVSGNLANLDTRVFRWQRCSKGYFNVWQELAKPAKREKAKEDSHARCGWCGERLVERRVGEGLWEPFCRKCKK